MICALLLIGVLWSDGFSLGVHASRPSYVQVPIPTSIDAGQDGRFASLRVLDEGEHEVPYVIDAQHRSLPERSAKLSDVGYVKGHFSEAVADLGDAGTEHSAVAIDSSEQTYFRRVEIATSEDRHVWKTLREDALIYRVKEDCACGNSVVEYGSSHARWLRIRVLGAKFPIQGVRVVQRESASERFPLVTIASGIATASASSTREQTFQTDLGHENASLSAVVLTTKEAEFSREAVVESSSDGTTWETIQNLTFARFPNDFSRGQSIFAERRARYWRVRINNGNDAPINDLHVAFMASAHTLLFRARPEHRYRLVGGDPSAREPTYDLGERLDHEDWRIAEIARIGTHEHRELPPQGPWTERQRGLIIAVCTLIAIVLGASALGTLRRIQSS